MIGLALVCVFSFAGLQTGQEYFQKALSKERAEGNLREAISLYQKAIEYSKDEALSAKAQLQIGLCYEKLGLQEAERAFRLVVEKYPNQNDVVKQARERLERLAAASAAPAVIAGGLSLRKLDIPIGVPSPDGKYIATNESDGDLFLFEIENKRKTIVKASSVENGFFQYGVSWSPDSRQFAYVWKSPQHYNELYVWQLGATEPRFVCGSDRKIEFGNIAGWAPDKNWIYIQYRLRTGISKSLGRISVKSGEFMSICAIEGSEYNMRLSPDGKYLAFNLDTSPQDHDIRLLATNSWEQTVLLKHQGMDSFLNWTPDGSYIIYSSYNFNQKGLWLLKIENGGPSGTPISVNIFGENIDSVGTTNAGAFFIKTSLSGTDACMAQIDLISGELIHPVQAIEPEALGWTTTPFWSVDGGSLAYFFKKKVDLTTRYRFDTLKIKSMGTGIIKEYVLDFLADPQSGPLPRWSTDGRSIFVLGKKNDAIGLFKYDLEKKTSGILLNDRDICAFSADGEILYLDRMIGKTRTKTNHTLYRKTLSTGKESIVYSGGVGEGVGRIRLSPDDSIIGFNSSEILDLGSVSVLIIPANPEKPLTKKDARIFPGVWIFDMGPSGNGLLLFKQAPLETKPTIQTLYYPTIDPAISPIPIQFSNSWGNIAFHPDGKTVAFTQSTNRGEFWMLENILPKK